MKHQVFLLSGEPQRLAAIKFLRAVNLDKPLKITIEDLKQRRSLSQNALLWATLTEITKIISDQTGNDPEDLNEFFKRRFLVPEIVEISGQVIEKYSTKKLTPAEMSRYIDAITQFAAQELQIILPAREDTRQ